MSTDFSWLAIRCTFLHPLPTPNWLTISFLDRTVNPGPDLIHCHLSQHATGGMVEVLLEGIELGCGAHVSNGKVRLPGQTTYLATFALPSVYAAPERQACDLRSQ